jgi:hypothetical protein
VVAAYPLVCVVCELDGCRLSERGVLTPIATRLLKLGKKTTALYAEARTLHGELDRYTYGPLRDALAELVEAAGGKPRGRRKQASALKDAADGYCGVSFSGVPLIRCWDWIPPEWPSVTGTPIAGTIAAPLLGVVPLAHHVTFIVATTPPGQVVCSM